MKKILLLLALPIYQFGNAQHTNDSAKALQEIVVKAYESNRRLLDVPAAVSVVTNAQLNRFSNTNILPVLNTQPGVRMEERSPGSYRLSIRGSSLRSPFGVRNVKVYYNDIPYTDPGGNTYFNQLGFYNFNSLEILKGPAGSLYGAGTGGVVLVTSNSKDYHPGVSLNYSFGSYGLQNTNINLRAGNESVQNTLNYQHQTTNGYREWTKMKRDVFTWDAAIKTNEQNQLNAHFLFGDLFYQTPGALTKVEYDTYPEASRPAVGRLPSAMQANASIKQKIFFAGISYNQKISGSFTNTTSLYGAYADIVNPTFRNYEIRSEPHFGGRTNFRVKREIKNIKIIFNAGAELQKSFNRQTDFGNRQGNIDTVQTDDLIKNLQALIFLQANIEIPNQWIITLGECFSNFKVKFKRISTIPSVSQSRNTNNEFSPRIAVLKKLTPAISVFASIAKGFSPPTTAELLPSSGIINTILEAEKGINYELGTRGTVFNTEFYFDITAFYFTLKNTIVQRRDATGGDFFVNAGSTKQKGIETYLSYRITDNNSATVKNAKLFISYSLQSFHYDDFKRLTADYSGNRLPGIAPHTFSAGADVNTRLGIYANVTYYYTAKLALNDANTDYASSFHLLGARAGYKSSISNKINFEIFAGADNMLNVKYSLGNDINAFGGRYYNAAPIRNYFAGINFTFPGPKPVTEVVTR